MKWLPVELIAQLEKGGNSIMNEDEARFDAGYDKLADTFTWRELLEKKISRYR